MALEKTITQPEGYDVVLWRILSLNMNFEESLREEEWLFVGRARVVFGGFTTTDWRTAGVKPAVTYSININAEDFQQLIGENQSIYEQIRSVLEQYAIDEVLSVDENGNPIETGLLYNATPHSQTNEWQVDTAYSAGDVITYEGTEYECLQAHTSQVGWEPPNVPALWTPTGT